MLRRAGRSGALALGVMLTAMAAAAGAGPPEGGLAAQALPVKIALTEGGFWFHNIGIRASTIDLEVINQGQRDHALAIIARGRSKRLAVETPVLAPGASTKLILRLPVGRYEIYSPVDHDRDHGLAAPMEVISPSPTSRAGAEMNRVFYNY